MALQVTVNVHNGFLNFTGIELVRSTDLIEHFRDIFRCITGQSFQLFLVNVVPDLFDHLIFCGYQISIEHILVVLIKIIVQLLFYAARYIQLFQDLLGEFNCNLLEDLFCLILNKTFKLFGLGSPLLG